MALPQIRAFSQPDPACQPHTWRLAPSFAWMGWGGPRCPAAPRAWQRSETCVGAGLGPPPGTPGCQLFTERADYRESAPIDNTAAAESGESKQWEKKEQKETSHSGRIWGFCCVWRGKKKWKKKNLRQGCTARHKGLALGAQQAPAGAVLPGVREHGPADAHRDPQNVWRARGNGWELLTGVCAQHKGVGPFLPRPGQPQRNPPGETPPKE